MLDDQENDDWPLLSAIHGTNQELPKQISRALHNLMESSRQEAGCGGGEAGVPWPCFDYDAASKFLFFQTSNKEKPYPGMLLDQGTFYEPSWDMSRLWTWALTPELLITWVCLAIFLAIIGCCWICTQLSDWLCKIAVILCLTTVLVSLVLAFSVSAAV